MAAVDVLGRVDELASSMDAVTGAAIGSYRKSRLNGLVPAGAMMDAATMPALRMPNRDGFIPDDRPDTKVARCMPSCR